MRLPGIADIGIIAAGQAGGMLAKFAVKPFGGRVVQDAAATLADLAAQAAAKAALQALDSGALAAQALHNRTRKF